MYLQEKGVSGLEPATHTNTGWGGDKFPLEENVSKNGGDCSMEHFWVKVMSAFYGLNTLNFVKPKYGLVRAGHHVFNVCFFPAF